MRRRKGLSVPALALALLLVGCGGGDSDDETHDNDHHSGSGHHGSSDSADVETDQPELPASAPSVPDVDALAKRGFDCRELPPGETGDDAQYVEGQSHELCLLDGEEIAATWSMNLYDGHVLGWEYIAWPRGERAELKALAAAHTQALRTVFDTLLPQDVSVMKPALAEWTTPKDTKTWTFEGISHEGLTGAGSMNLDAELVDVPPSMSLSARPGSAGPELDPEAFLDAAQQVGWGSCQGEDRGEEWGHEIVCDLGDFTFRIDIGSNGVLNSFAITNFGSDQGKRVLSDLTEIADATGSPSFVDFVSTLTKASVKGEEKLVWLGGVPALITPLDHPGGLQVDAKVLIDPLT